MRTLAFVRALLARWDRRVLRPQPLGLVFLRRPEPSARAQPLRPRWRTDLHLHLRPRVELTLVRHGDTAARTSIDASRRTTILPPTGALVLRATTTERTERLLERTLERGHRIETVASLGAATALGAEGAVRMPPAPAPVRSGLVVRQERIHAAEPAPPTSSPPGFHPPRPEVAAAAEPPALDLGRLTDQVLSAIDSRLVAHAERMGRS